MDQRLKQNDVHDREAAHQACADAARALAAYGKRWPEEEEVSDGDV